MEPKRIYVASSWRNTYQPSVVRFLLEQGHKVYDFRHPTKHDNGFAWSQIDPDYKQWSPKEFREALDSPVAIKGFGFDLEALHFCDACILVLPCGRSAHLELGSAIGAKKITAIYIPELQVEPELMYKLADKILINWEELENWSTYVKKYR